MDSTSVIYPSLSHYNELYPNHPLPAVRPPSTPSISIPVSSLQHNLRYSLSSSTSSVTSTPPDSPTLGDSSYLNPSPPRSSTDHTASTSIEHKKRKRGRPPLEKDSRHCSHCGTTSTPEWRKGPHGPHTLCNACGLQYMKAQRKENQARQKHSLGRVLNTSDGVLSGSTGVQKQASSSSSPASSPPPLISSSTITAANGADEDEGDENAGGPVIARHRGSSEHRVAAAHATNDVHNRNTAMNVLPLHGSGYYGVHLLSSSPTDNNNNMMCLNNSMTLTNPNQSLQVPAPEVSHSYPPMQMTRYGEHSMSTIGLLTSSGYVTAAPLQSSMQSNSMQSTQHPLQNSMQATPLQSSLQSSPVQSSPMQIGSLHMGVSHSDLSSKIHYLSNAYLSGHIQTNSAPQQQQPLSTSQHLHNSSNSIAPQVSTTNLLHLSDYSQPTSHATTFDQLSSPYHPYQQFQQMQLQQFQQLQYPHILQHYGNLSPSSGNGHM